MQILMKLNIVKISKYLNLFKFDQYRVNKVQAQSFFALTLKGNQMFTKHHIIRQVSKHMSTKRHQIRRFALHLYSLPPAIFPRKQSPDSQESSMMAGSAGTLPDFQTVSWREQMIMLIYLQVVVNQTGQLCWYQTLPDGTQPIGKVQQFSLHYLKIYLLN